MDIEHQPIVSTSFLTSPEERSRGPARDILDPLFIENLHKKHPEYTFPRLRGWAHCRSGRSGIFPCQASRGFPPLNYVNYSSVVNGTFCVSFELYYPWLIFCVWSLVQFLVFPCFGFVPILVILWLCIIKPLSVTLFWICPWDVITVCIHYV